MFRGDVPLPTPEQLNGPRVKTNPEIGSPALKAKILLFEHQHDAGDGEWVSA